MATTRADTLYFLSGNGDMARLMRSFDWAATPLGAPRTWPQSLRSALSICLGSAFPIALYWGPELALVYNDAWSPILGAKHPWGLGRSGREVWPEIWDTIGPLFEHVLSTGEATYSEDQLLPMRRHGFTEECYFNYTFSPIRGESGRVEGIFNAVVETTYRVIHERRTRLLRELGERTAATRSSREACTLAAVTLGAAPADLPFCAVYLVDEAARGARLAGVAGLDPGGPAAPAFLPLDDTNAPWPLALAQKSGRVEVVSALPERFGFVLPGGPWPEPASAALLAPIVTGASSRAAGFLVVGASPRLSLDEAYRQFVERAATHVATALANAAAYEAEAARAAALAEIDRAKTVFFSNVSHEFRTPLALMLGPLEDALATSERALGGESLTSVHRNALRLLKLVNTLLDFARIEAGRAQASYEPTDLGRLTAELASSFESAFVRAGLVFEIDCPALAEPIFVDHDMWEKIVLNLVSNALKFTFEGRVRVALRACDGHVELAVSDTGTGIPEAELPRLFERFHRVQGARARTHEGSGIGLALVHELVRLHGGSLQVMSKLGEGTTFTVVVPRGFAHLPQERVEAARDLTSTATGAAPYVAEALRWLPGAGEPAPTNALAAMDLATDGLEVHPGARVLLADDNADMRAYVERILGARWTVEAVSDGETALEAARRERPDLVLTDVMMPKLDGFGLLRALREGKGTKDIPVIMLSARAGDEARIEGLVAGADDYLVKPFSARELVARVATHLQVAEVRRAAEKERARLYAVFEQAPVAITVFRGPAFIYELANPRYLAMVGKHDIVGRGLFDVFPEIVDEPITQALLQVYATGETFVGEIFRADIERGRGHIEEAYWNFSLDPMRDEDGAIVGVVQVVTDVSEQERARKRLEEAGRERENLLVQAQEARREAEAANRSKDEFLAMLGHELRNPLAPIFTALHLMSLRAAGVAQRERTVIERQVKHLAALVDDLLDVSRITRGKVELKKQKIEIADVVAKAIELASPLLEQRRHHLTVEVPTRRLAVDGDATRLAQVVSNLLTNAAKYTETGGRIAVTAERHGGQIVLRVHDSGIGIAPDMLPRVFDLFTQERQAIDRSQGGLGLGLAIVKSLVVLHGGTVEAYSEGRGRGSEVTVRLPAAEDRTEDVMAMSMHSAGTGAAVGSFALGGRRVLIVDDNQDAALLLSDALSELGHTTRVAHDGPEALQIAAEFVPEVAVLDIGLPVMDGFELARRLREQPALRRARLIALTGYGQQEDRQRSAEAGFDAHLVKPVQIQRLKAFIDAAAERGT